MYAKIIVPYGSISKIWFYLDFIYYSESTTTKPETCEKIAKKHINILNMDKDLAERIALMKIAHNNDIAVFINNYKSKINSSKISKCSGHAQIYNLI